MSTAFYLYHIPDQSYGEFDYRSSLEQCLERKVPIGVRTVEGHVSHRQYVFTWIMHPAAFMGLSLAFYGVIDECGNMMIAHSFVKQLEDITIMKYDKENIPE